MHRIGGAYNDCSDSQSTPTDPSNTEHEAVAPTAHGRTLSMNRCRAIFGSYTGN